MNDDVSSGDWRSSLEVLRVKTRDTPRFCVWRGDGCLKLNALCVCLIFSFSSGQALRSEAAHFRRQLSSSSCESTPPSAQHSSPEINHASPPAEMSHVSRQANPILSPEASLLLMAKVARKTMRQCDGSEKKQHPRRQREEAACCQHAAFSINVDSMLLLL